MRTLLFLALYGALLPQADLQEDIPALVQKLGADKVSDRQEAEGKLKALGKTAAPALREALASSDGETRARAKVLLRILELRETLPSSLVREFPDAPERLATGYEEWTALFFKTDERIGSQVPGVLPSTLGRADLDAIVANALRGARTVEERRELSSRIWSYRPPGALPALVELLKSPSAQIRNYACETLLALNENPSVAAALVPLLGDPEVCVAAAGALSKHGYWRVVPEILSFLDHADPRVKTNAIGLVGRLQIREALPALRALVGEADPGVRRESFMARREMGDRESLQDFVTAAQGSDPDLRHGAAFALVDGRELEAVRAIKDWIENPQYDRLAYAVPAAGRLKLREAVPGLLQLMKVKTPSHRDDTISEAAFALAEIRDPASIPGLKELLGHGSAEVRKYALSALGGMGARDALPEMEVLLKDKDPSVRSQAVGSIVEAGGKEGIPKILDRVKDPAARVRAACADALRMAEAREYAAVLIPMLKDADSLVSGRSFWAVKVLKPEGAVEAFLGLLGDPGWEAPFVLADWGVGDHLPRIRALLSDPRPEARSHAATLLGRVGDTVSIPSLKELLKDRVPGVRSSAASALVRLKAEGMLEVLVKLREDPETKAGWVWSFGLLGREGFPTLEKLLADPNPDNREMIVRVLVQAGGRDAIPVLLRSLDDPKDTIRTLALWQLVIELHAWEEMPAIVRKLEERGDEQWGWLAYYSARAGNAEPLALILEKSRSSSCEDRVRVIEAVAQVRARDCVPALRGMLNDRSPTVAGAAAEALGELEVGDAVTAIRPLLSHLSIAARRGAARALCRLGERDGAKVLVEEDGAGLFSLNRLRQPAMWKRLAELPLPTVPGRTLREALPKLSAQLGILFELGPTAWGHPDYLGETDYTGSRPEGRSVLDVLREIRSADVVLEADRVRVLRKAEGWIFWREWWALESKTKK